MDFWYLIRAWVYLTSYLARLCILHIDHSCDHNLWARAILVIIPFDLRPSVLRDIDLYTIAFFPSCKRSKYSLDDSRPSPFCWLVLFFTPTWLMYAVNHWRCSIKESFQSRLFIKALSSLERLVIHLLLHDSLHNGKTEYFWAFFFCFFDLRSCTFLLRVVFQYISRFW